MTITKNLVLIFDWGDTIMRDFDLPGKMKDWPCVAYIEGAEEMLKAVSNKYICCIATSTDKSDCSDMVEALRRVGADKYFRHFFASNDIGFAKPDPGFFGYIKAQLPYVGASYVSIGNLYEKDVVPAKLAGMKTILFNEKDLQGDFPAADHIIRAFNELPEILMKLD